MPKPFFERLQIYFSDIGNVLRGEANIASVFPNSTDVGVSRERIYAEMLKLHLPSSSHVTLGGFLFGMQGAESNQMDVMVSNDSALRFDFHNKDGSGKSFACIDGCIGLVSIKSKLDSTSLIDCLHNIGSIPNKQPLYTLPLIEIKSYEDWPYKVIYATDGINVNSLLIALNDFYVGHPEIPVHKRPNIIHVASKYVIERVRKEGGRTRDGNVIAPNTFHAMEDTTDAYALFKAISEIQGIATASQYVKYEYSSLIDNFPFLKY